MAVNYSTAVKNSRLTQVVNTIDAAAGNGTLRIYDAAGTLLLAELPLSKPCGTVSNGVLTFAAITSDTSANATGTAAFARIFDGAATPVEVIGGLTVGTSGSNINLNSTAISSGQQVSITSGSITHG